MQENDLKKILLQLFWIFTILSSVLIGAYLGREQVTNPFLHYDVAFTEAGRDERQVTFPDEGALSGLRYTRGRELWMISMNKLLGLKSQVILQFLPIGSILLSLVYFAFFKRLLGSDTLAALMTLYQMMSPSHLGGVYSVFAYALGLTLYLGWVLLFMRVQEKKRILDVLLLFAIAVAANAVHYAYTVWIVLTGTIVNVWIWAMRRGLDSRQRSQIPEYTLSFILFVVVIFFTFSEVFYDSYLPLVGNADALGGGWAVFFHQLPWRTGLARGEVNYEFSYSRNQLLSVLSTLNLLLILLPIAAGILLRIFRRMRSHRETTDFSIVEAVMWALILTGLLDMAIYSLRGNIGLKYLLLIYPVATIWFLRQFGGRRLVAAMLVLLLGLSSVRLIAESTIGYIGTKPLSYSESETVATWYHQHTVESNALLFADLNLYGKLLVKGASYQYPGLHRPRLMVITPEVYDWLLGRDVTDTDELARINTASYFALDVVSDAPIKTFFWRELQPFGWYRSSIERNSASVKLYDDGLVWILQP